MTKLRASRVLRRLRAGQGVGCIKINSADARVVEIAALSGIDCLWLDMEHVPSALNDIENQIRAAKMHDVDVVVRVRRGSYSDLIVPLEMDASGVMVPHVMTAAEAGKIVSESRFHPLGRRPLDGGNADAQYCHADIAAYIAHANHERFVIVQIEDPEALAELDSIAGVPGIDMLFFGAGDFSHGIGHPGDWDHPLLLDAQRRISDAARRHGKFAGTVGTIESIGDLHEAGYQFISVGADVVGLHAYFRKIAGAFGTQAMNGTRSIYNDFNHSTETIANAQS